MSISLRRLPRSLHGAVLVLASVALLAFAAGLGGYSHAHDGREAGLFNEECLLAALATCGGFAALPAAGAVAVQSLPASAAVAAPALAPSRTPLRTPASRAPPLA
jgi:hypothetical protein